ncbi:MAG: NAD(P)/FAD-dependent oxidoreductase [Bdellovibrionota bacterium]
MSKRLPHEIEIRVPPEKLHDETFEREALSKALGVAAAELPPTRLIRRSLDARGKAAVYLLRFLVGRQGDPAPFAEVLKLQNVSKAEPVIIVGFGPAGMFAALRLIELGFKPVILERGKAVRDRRHDIAAITKRGIVNPDSNYCFGEGGAGTFSDGKLYTRATKRGSVDRILQIFVAHGADPEIRIDAHPHIGTNKLPKVVQTIREQVVACGGEMHFNSRVSKIVRSGSAIRGVILQDGTEVLSKAVILAAGHSSRDLFQALVEDGYHLEQKPFALGVRVEHPQPLIDAIQYRSSGRSEHLPPAAYALKAQCAGRGVFSFCMCPGGIICPSATANDEVVVNGWSPSKRNSRFANSGIVVQVTDEDLQSFNSAGALAGIALQQSLERHAALLGGGVQAAPAQRLDDFVNKRESKSLPECSYLPGVRAVNLDLLFPDAFASRLRAAFRDFDKQRPGYLTNEALVVGVESRTSCPVRVPRDRETMMHLGTDGLFPVGEGAGYAGGIVSAAMDGENAADAVQKFLLSAAR